MYTHYCVRVYFLPILGAILADGWLGKNWTILCYRSVYCLGNLRWRAWPVRGESLSGNEQCSHRIVPDCWRRGIKPCVSANVGDQFGDRTGICSRKCLAVLFSHQRRLLYFFDSLSVAPCESEVGDPVLGIGIPGIRCHRTLFFWAVAKNGPRAAAASAI